MWTGLEKCSLCWYEELPLVKCWGNRTGRGLSCFTHYPPSCEGVVGMYCSAIMNYERHVLCNVLCMQNAPCLLSESTVGKVIMPVLRAAYLSYNTVQ